MTESAINPEEYQQRLIATLMSKGMTLAEAKEEFDSMVQAEIRLRKMISSYSPEELAEMDREITLEAARLEEARGSTPFSQRQVAVFGKQYWRDLAEATYQPMR